MTVLVKKSFICYDSIVIINPMNRLLVPANIYLFLKLKPFG